MNITIEPTKRKVEDNTIDLKQRTILALDICFEKDGEKYRLAESFIHTMFFEDEVDDMNKELEIVYSPVSVVIDGLIESKQKLIEVITNVCASLKLYVHSFGLKDNFYVAYARDDKKYLGNLEYSPVSAENLISATVKVQLEDDVDYEKELDIRIKEPLEKISYKQIKNLGYDFDDYGIESFAILREEDAKRLVNYTTTVEL